MELETMLAIGELIMKHGVPAALAIIKAWEVENPTLADIEALKDKVPEPAAYFGRGPRF